jgi:hypothetical protein
MPRGCASNSAAYRSSALLRPTRSTDDGRHLVRDGQATGPDTVSDSRVCCALDVQAGTQRSNSTTKKRTSGPPGLPPIKSNDGGGGGGGGWGGNIARNLMLNAMLWVYTSFWTAEVRLVAAAVVAVVAAVAVAVVVAAEILGGRAGRSYLCGSSTIAMMAKSGTVDGNVQRASGARPSHSLARRPTRARPASFDGAKKHTST